MQFVTGETTHGKASSLTVAGDALYSYGYKVAQRAGDAGVCVNVAPTGESISDVNESMAFSEHKPHILSDAAARYFAGDAAFSRTTERARTLVRDACMSAQVACINMIF